MDGRSYPVDRRVAVRSDFPAAARAVLPAPAAARAADTVPACLFTLAQARAGQTLTVRTILAGAGESAAMLRPGDTLRCSTRSEEWLVVELAGRGELAVHRSDAALVHAERGSDAARPFERWADA